MVASAPLRRSVVAVVLSGALLAGGTACSGDSTKDTASSSSASSSASPTSSAEKQKLAKTRFVANAGLAAGATYQWIVKPYKKGKFKKGADGRTFTLIKAGLVGTFAYNRLKAALNNAKGDPLLARAVAPLSMRRRVAEEPARQAAQGRRRRGGKLRQRAQLGEGRGQERGRRGQEQGPVHRPAVRG